jgi:NAD(P)-dependent dehydrogenase (short-subunit alcohol dehydrogenase family)
VSVVLITGASAGIGNLTAKALAADGHTVYASMRSVIFGLALWLGMVYYAAAHPENRPRKGAPPQQSGAAHYRVVVSQDPAHVAPAPAPATPDREESENIPARAA